MRDAGSNGGPGGIDGACYLGACRVDADCPNGDRCGLYRGSSFGACGYVDTTCRVHADCTNPAMPYCRDHPDSSISGFCSAGCFTDADCANLGALGKCGAEGICTTGCRNDTECIEANGADWYCSTASACTMELGSCAISQCVVDADCAGLDGYRCRDCGTSRRCLPSCASNADCATRFNDVAWRCDVAGSGTCYLSGQVGGQCLVDADCPQSQRCQSSCIRSPCGPSGLCRDRCVSDADCALGSCLPDGSCGCERDADCDLLQTCAAVELCPGVPCDQRSCQQTGCRDTAECRAAIQAGSPIVAAFTTADLDLVECRNTTCALGCTNDAACRTNAQNGGFLARYASLADRLECLSVGGVRSCVLTCGSDRECVSAAAVVGLGPIAAICEPK